MKLGIVSAISMVIFGALISQVFLFCPSCISVFSGILLKGWCEIFINHDLIVHMNYIFIAWT